MIPSRRAALFDRYLMKSAFAPPLES